MYTYKRIYLNYQEDRKITPQRAHYIARIHHWIESKMKIQDGTFDFLLPQEAFDASAIHWTPFSVIYEVLRALNPSEETRLLDVGSGCGKFCIAAALLSPGLYTGVELRPWLHEAATTLKEELGVLNVGFIQGDMADLDWSSYNTFYFYNPFHEQIVDEKVSGQQRIDYSIDFNVDTYLTYRRTVFEKLEACPPGTKVVTYHGFGGILPEAYNLRICRKAGSGEVKLWVKSVE